LVKLGDNRYDWFMAIGAGLAGSRDLVEKTSPELCKNRNFLS